MKSVCLFKKVVLGAMLAAMLMAGLVSTAEAGYTVIQPVSTTLEPNGDSYLQFDPRWINGAGLMDASIVETGDPVPAVWPEHISGYNLNRVERIRNADEFETLTFDLGGAFELGGMVLWNSTESGQTERGFEHTALSYSTDGGVTFVSGETLTWTERNGVDEVSGNQGDTEPVDGWITFAPEVQMLAVPVAGVTHVRMVVDNFSEAGANNITLVSELRFIAVPEPATMVLLGLGSLLLRKKRS